MGSFAQYPSDSRSLNRALSFVERSSSVGGSSRRPYFVAPRTEATELANLISSDDIPIFGDDNRDGLSPLDALLTLQEAIDRCKNDVGDRICVMRGTHSLTTPVLFNKRGIIVESVDMGFGDAIGERWMLYGPNDAPAAIITKACKIRGLGFSGQWTGAASHNLQVDAAGGGFEGGFFSIKRCEFTTWGASPDYGILLKGATAAEISDNIISGGFDTYNVGGIGISTDTSGGVQVSSCLFENNRFITMGQNKYAFVHLAGKIPHNNIIKGNILVGNNTDDAGWKGIGKFLDNNGCANKGTLVCDNWIGLATDATSYDDTVVALTALGIRFAGNHYAE